MHNLPARDGDRTIDWSLTSDDYARFRPGYPESFWAHVQTLGVGLPGQRILDLGTGTGNLARALARMNTQVTGVDVAEDQIRVARELADAEGIDARFHVAPAEETGLASRSFDSITASQCWLYFDRSRVIDEVKRLLLEGGTLMTCHLCWLPRDDEIARRSEELVLEFNPDWSAADWSGDVPEVPTWSKDDFETVGRVLYDEVIPFTRESWRGRFRACRGVGATLSAADVRAFDEAHDELLREIAPDEFTVLHRIDAHAFIVRED